MRRHLWIILAMTVVIALVAPTPAGAAKVKTVQFKSGSYSVSESTSPAAVAITLSPKGNGSIHFRTAGGTATSGADCTSSATDFVPVADQLVTFANQSQRSATVTICNNNTNEPNETVVLQLFDPSAGTSLGSKSQVTLNIQDDDVLPALSVNDRPAILEGGSRTFTVTSSALSLQPMSVQWQTANGTAVSPGDFDVQTGFVAIAPLATTATFVVTSNDDSVDEDTEWFKVQLVNPINASIGDGEGVFTITDDADLPPSISVADAADTDEDSGPMTFDVTLSSVSGKTVTVNWDLLAVSADPGFATCATGDPAPEDDFLNDGGTLTFSPGDTSETISVTLCADAMDENDEDIGVILSSAANASINDGGASGTIVDDDAAPSLSITDESVEENDGTITFTVTLSAASAKTVTVDHEADFGTASSYTAASGTCFFASPPGDDYGELSGTDGTLTFNPGETTQEITHNVCGDTVPEVDEQFSVNLVASTEVNATILDGQGIGTIVNDDNSTMTFGTTAVAGSPYLEAGGSLSGVFSIVACPGIPLDCELRVNAPNTLTFTAPAATSFDLISVDLELVVTATLSVSGTPGGSLLSPTATLVTHTINAAAQTSADLTATLDLLAVTGGVLIDNIVFRIH